MSRIDIGDTETEQHIRTKKSTDMLFARLTEHHDMRIFMPEKIEPPAPPKPSLPQIVYSIEETGKRYPSIFDIQRAVAQYFGIKVDDLSSSRRNAKLVMARHIGMYLCRNLTVKSFPYISTRFGKIDHSVSVYACKKVRQLCQQDWEIAHDVAHLEAVFS